MLHLLSILNLHLKIFPDKKKISGLDGFTDKLYKVFKNEIILIPNKHFQKIKKE